MSVVTLTIKIDPERVSRMGILPETDCREVLDALEILGRDKLLAALAVVQRDICSMSYQLEYMSDCLQPRCKTLKIESEPKKERP